MCGAIANETKAGATPPPPTPHYQSLFFACAGLLGSEEDGPRHKMTKPPFPTHQGYIQRSRD